MWVEVACCSSKDALGQFDAVVDLRPTGLRLLRRVDELQAVIGCLNQDHGIGLATLAPGASAGVWPSASLDQEDRALAEDPHLVACGAPPARPATRPDLVRPLDDQIHTLSQCRPDDFRCRLDDAH